MTSTLTSALAGLALASLPMLVDAQSTSTQSPQQRRPRQTTGTTSQQNRSTTDQNSPQYHLDAAKRILAGINANTVRGEAGTRIRELKRHFNQLESAWRASSANSARTGAARSTEQTGAHTTASRSTSGTASGTTGTAGTGTEQTGARRTPRSGAASGMAGTNDWLAHYTAITNLLDQMGATSASVSGQAGTTASTTAGTTGSATGTTGRPGEEVGVGASANVTLDANVRSKLVEFRRHLDQFHAAAVGQSGRGEEDVASANPNSGITGAMTGTGTSPTATGTTGAASQTTTAATTGTSTQTPAQTTGAMSASASVDSATIARLTASIDELLRGGAATSTAAGTTTGTPTGTTGGTVSGTAGTSGTTSATGTVCVDRAKLEQLRRDIQALQNPPSQ